MFFQNSPKGDNPYRSFMAICSNIAEPVLAFQFPDIDFLLKTQQQIYQFLTSYNA